MEEVLPSTITVLAQADRNDTAVISDRIVDMYFNGNGAKLKEAIIPKLEKKVEDFKEDHPVGHLNLLRITSMHNDPSSVPLRRQDVSLSDAQLYMIAEKLLTSALHEVMVDKDKKIEAEEKRGKIKTIIAMVSSAGTFLGAVGIILSLTLPTHTCTECICASLNTTL